MGIVISGNKNLKFIKAVYYQPVMPPPTPEKYLTIEALKDNFYISYTDFFYENGFTEEEIQQLCDESGWEYEKMQYSFDKINWYILEPYDHTPFINAGEKIYLKRRCITPGLFEMSSMSLTNIFCDYQYNLSGNCNSILFGDGDGELFDGCFYQLFTSNYGLINISESFLPATTLADNCYAYMFDCCTSLVTAPELPATTLDSWCYYGMFAHCTSLVTAPELPATTLTNYCYNYMFADCSSLVSAPELSATTLTEYCYAYMFSHCTSLVTAPELPATTLDSWCYYGMFANCTSLVTAPELPATKLVGNCYQSMFQNCSSLVTAPELPATTLRTNCYINMFDGCTKLNYIKALFTTTPSSTYTSNWVKGVSSTGTFIKNKNAIWNVTGVHGIPSGWVVQTA